MKKMTLKPIIMSALAALAFGTVSVGTTFALFTDKAETKINVKAGVVDVDNEISIKEVKELGGVDAVKDANEKLYTNSIGSTTELLSNKAVKLTNWVPGDKAVFTINSVNKSNVNIKTRFTVKHTTSDPDKDLYEALTISYKALDENNQDIGYKFMDWNLLPAVSETDIANGGKVISKVEVTVEFKDDGDKTIRERTEGLNNGYQGKDCEITFTQEAVQGNASVKSKIEEMNALLAAELTPNKTMHEALSDVSSVMDASQLLIAGYVWNAETDRFAYPQEAPTESKYKYFKVYDEMPAVADQEFSVYAYDTSWTTTAVNLNGIGFDAGTVSGIASVSYTNDGDSRDVVIRTNGGKLTVNAPLDTIKHYGEADSINIIAVASASYHEYGTVGFTQIAKGHYVAESGAEITVLLATGTGTDVTVDNEGAEIEKSYTTDSTAKETLHGGNESLDYYEVTPTGTQTQEQALAEVIENLEIGATLFAGGTGKENDPYLVSNRVEFENMSEIESYSYFKWVGDSNVDASNWSSSNYLCGSFDGNGVVFNNLDCFLFRAVWNGSESWNPAEDIVNTYTIKNLTVNANIVSDGWMAAVVRVAGVHNFAMENVTVHGYVEGSTGVASFVCFGAGNYAPNAYTYDGHITFKNCNSDAIIVAKSGNAVGFIAHAMTATSAATVTLENSNYTGTMSCSSCKYICGNWINATITDDQSSTKNNLIYKTSDNGWKYIAEGKTGSFTVKTGTLPSNIGDVFELDAESGATKAVISLVISPNPGCFTSTYMTEEVNVVDGKFTSENVKYFTIRINANGVTEAGVHGNYYDVVNSIYDGTLGANTTVRFTQYNAAGGIISITNYNFNDK